MACHWLTTDGRMNTIALSVSGFRDAIRYREGKRMVIRVLGSAGAELPDFNPPAFLVDDILLLDAGTIGAVLSAAEQERIRHVFLTHAHLDHVRGIPFL